MLICDRQLGLLRKDTETSVSVPEVARGGVEQWGEKEQQLHSLQHPLEAVPVPRLQSSSASHCSSESSWSFWELRACQEQNLSPLDPGWPPRRTWFQPCWEQGCRHCGVLKRDLFLSSSSWQSNARWDSPSHSVVLAPLAGDGSWLLSPLEFTAGAQFCNV